MNDRTAEALNTFELPPSERHRLLAAERRRLALDILTGTTSVVELEDLAAEIAAREDGTLTGDDAIKRVGVSLHHVHLPQMDKMGILDYDPELHLIKPAEPLQL